MQIWPKGWWPRTRKASDAKEDQSQGAESVREFVYLDEVSVYSLTSSPDTPPAVSLSEVTGKSNTSTWGTHAQVEAPGFARAGTKADFTDVTSGGLEIQRQFNVQSTFAVLHREYKEQFLITSRRDTAVPKSRSEHETSKTLKELSEAGWAIPESDLARGKFVELQVALRAHPVFDVVTFIKSFGSLFEKFPSLMGSVDHAQVSVVLEGGSMIEELMVHLVPIEGVATSHVVVNHDNQSWVVDRRALDTTHVALASPPTPLRVVGVAERDLFWKDTRRLLHADLEFDVLARISRPGLRPNWTPVKTMESLDKVLPGIGDKLNAAIAGIDTSVADSHPNSTVEGTVDVVSALWDSLDEHYGTQTSTARRQTLEPVVVQGTSLETDLVALGAVIDAFHSEHSGLERDPDADAEKRDQAWLNSGHTQMTEQMQKHSQTAAAAECANALEVEFVAMYW